MKRIELLSGFNLAQGSRQVCLWLSTGMLVYTQHTMCPEVPLKTFPERGLEK